MWKGIPGTYDLGIFWNHYFYNATNAKDVLYRGAKPEFTEFGPYIYRENDDYTNLEYGEMTDATDGITKPSVSMDFVQTTNFEKDSDGFLDTKMWLAN